MDPGSSRLGVVVTDGNGRPVRAPGLSRWLQDIAPAKAVGVVSVALVSDAAIRALNRRYRGIAQATDVLAFPIEQQGRIDNPKATSPRPKPQAGPSPKPKAQSLKPDYLGDIVIATGRARVQALAAGHSFSTELRVLALHGLLHLLGYDHHASDDNGRMRRLESRLLRAGGVRDGLIARAGRTPTPAGRAAARR